MRIDIVSCVPKLLDSPLSHSILKRAQDKGLVEVVTHDLRDFASNKHRQIDDYPYGGGAGMVMMVEPVARCIRHLSKDRTYDEVIFLSPDGETLQQQMVNSLSWQTTFCYLPGIIKVWTNGRETSFSPKRSPSETMYCQGENSRLWY